MPINPGDAVSVVAFNLMHCECSEHYDMIGFGMRDEGATIEAWLLLDQAKALVAKLQEMIAKAEHPTASGAPPSATLN